MDLSFLQGLGNTAGNYLSGKPFAPTPAPGQPGAPAGPNFGHSIGDFIGRLNNSINPISILLGLAGAQPPNQYRPLWKASNAAAPAGTLPNSTPKEVQGP